MAWLMKEAEAQTLPLFLDKFQAYGLQILVFLAAIFMLLPVGMQYIGEEPFFAITSYEMLYSHDWSHATLYGAETGRLPLFQWLASIIAQLIGSDHMDISIRIVSIMASWCTAWGVAWFVRQRFDSITMAWWAALVFLTMGETMFWYGWLGYSDALFSCFIFLSITYLWHALEEKHAGWYTMAWCALGLAIMTKAITAYIFFGVAFLTLATGLHRWHFIMRPKAVAVALICIAIPWYIAYMSGHFQGFFYTLINDVGKHHDENWLNFLTHLFIFPFITLGRTLPLSLIVLFLAWKHRTITHNKNIRMLLIILVVNYLPYWFNATASPRYIIPLYGMLAVVLTYGLTQMEIRYQRGFASILMIIIIVKIPFSLWILPYTKGSIREGNNMHAVAADIIKRSKGSTILSENVAASGLGVVAYIDQQIFPERIVLAPSSSQKEAYILTYFQKSEYGALIQTYHIHDDAMYLYHRSN